jgi:hypothetical protein
VTEVAGEPLARDAGRLEGGDPARQRLGAVRAVREVPDTRLPRRRELQRRALVLAEAAQVNRVAVVTRDVHAEELAEVVEALLGSRRQELDVREVREVADGLAHAR